MTWQNSASDHIPQGIYHPLLLYYTQFTFLSTLYPGIPMPNLDNFEMKSSWVDDEELRFLKRMKKNVFTDLF